MRRLGGLYDEVVSDANLLAAWRDFEPGKRGRRDVRRFGADAWRRLPILGRELRAGTYRPGPYRRLVVRRPKIRLVAAATVRDRVVHHAIHRVLAPRLDASFSDHTYACLPGRGAHRAGLGFLRAMRRHRWMLLLDVRRYFLSVDRSILLGLMARRLRERPLLDLLERVMESGAGLYRAPEVASLLALEPGFPPEGCGLPIGNPTSQWWGNHYLSALDHFVKRDLRLPHAQRYMDDITLFADDRGRLEEAREACRVWLWAERRLHLKDPLAPVRSTRVPVTYLGWRVGRAGLEPSPSVLERAAARTARRVRAGDVEGVERSLASLAGILRFGVCERRPETPGPG